MTTIDTLELKKKMLQASIVKQQSLIDDFKTRIENILSTAGLGNEEKYDNNELAQNSQSSDEIGLLNLELKKSIDEMHVLESLKASISQAQRSVSPGAVVVTNRETFLVSVSTEQFEVDGKTFIGISVNSPIYEAMKGKAKGDKFSCKGITYRILDLF